MPILGAVLEFLQVCYCFWQMIKEADGKMQKIHTLEDSVQKQQNLVSQLWSRVQSQISHNIEFQVDLKIQLTILILFCQAKTSLRSLLPKKLCVYFFCGGIP